MKRQVEILSPAGSYESLKAAIAAGADAVYIGGSRFGARAFADNLNEEKLLEVIDYVHLHGRKIYLTVNTLLHDEEMEEELFELYLRYHFTICERADLVGASHHILDIFRKNALA